LTRYTYIAPGLSKKYGKKAPKTRNGYGYQRNNKGYYNGYGNYWSRHTSDNNETTPGLNSNNGDKSTSQLNGDLNNSFSVDNNNLQENKESAVDLPPPPQFNKPDNVEEFRQNIINNVHVNYDFHRINAKSCKNQISCCEDFMAVNLKKNASKYKCTIFAIGLNWRTKHSVRAIPKKSILNWLQLRGFASHHGTHHLFIEALPVNKLPHYLFPEEGYLRPSDAKIKMYQKRMKLCQEMWASKKLGKYAEGNESEFDVDERNLELLKKIQNGELIDDENVNITNITDDDDDPFETIKETIEVLPGLDYTITVEKRVERKKRKSNPNKMTTPPTKKIKTEPNNNDTNNENINNNGNITIKQESKSPNNNDNNDDKCIDESILNLDSSKTSEYITFLKEQSINKNLSIHEVTAFMTSLIETCHDKIWLKYLKKIISQKKYCWNGVKFNTKLNENLIINLANDIGKRYKQYKCL